METDSEEEEEEIDSDMEDAYDDPGLEEVEETIDAEFSKKARRLIEA